MAAPQVGPGSPGAAFLTDVNKMALTTANVNFGLLELQQLLGASALPPSDLITLRAYASTLSSTASASALNASAANSQAPTVKQLANKSENIFAAVGLQNRVARTAVKSFAIFVEKNKTKVHCAEADTQDFHNNAADDTLLFLGSTHVRELESVLFSMLRNATLDNFYVAYGPDKVDGEPMYTAPATAKGWEAAEKNLLQKFAAAGGEPAAFAASAASGLKPTLAGVIFSRDATLVPGGVRERSLTPTYITLANFTVEALRLFGSSTIWALTESFLPPPGMPAATASLYRRLLSHASMDFLYRSLHALRFGVLWELGPCNVKLLVPRAMWRNGDWPEHKGQLLLMAAPSAGLPCSTCEVPRKGACSTLISPQRKIADIMTHAACPPTKTLGATQQQLDDAKAMGSKPTGRPPAPLTVIARTITSPVLRFVLSPPGVMHCVRMLARKVQEAILLEAQGARLLSGIEQEKRRAALQPYRGAASRCSPPTAVEMLPGKKLPIDVHVSSLLLLHGLLEGAWGDAGSAEADAAGQQMFLLLRLVSYLAQSTLSRLDVECMRLLTAATTRSLRTLPELMRTVKLHESRHIPEAVPWLGSPLVFNDEKTEAMHNPTTLLSERVKQDKKHLSRMLWRADLQLWAQAVVDAQDARAAAGGLGAAGGAVNLAGLLGSPTFVPPALPPLLRADKSSVPSLGGFIAGVRVHCRLRGGPPLRVPGPRSLPPGERPGCPFFSRWRRAASVAV